MSAALSPHLSPAETFFCGTSVDSLLRRVLHPKMTDYSLLIFDHQSEIQMYDVGTQIVFLLNFQQTIKPARSATLSLSTPVMKIPRPYSTPPLIIKPND